MDGRTPRNEFVPLEPSDPASGRLIDLAEVRVERPRTRRLSSRSAKDDARPRLAGRDLDENEIGRVGGRRRLRAELVLMAGGVIFLVAALLKPWPSAPIGRGPDATSASASTEAPANLVAAAPSPEATARRTPIGWPDVPPGDYRWPFSAGNGSTPQPGNLGATPDPRWATVDWTVLGSIDPHDGWGYSIATMPDLALIPASNATPSPVTAWLAADSPNYTIIKVDPGREVFGLAVTWPHGIKVTAVTVGYMGDLDHPSQVPQTGFPANAQVSPVPGAQVTSGPLGAGTRGDSSAAFAAKAATPGSTIVPGQFWIPPSASPGTAASTSVRAAWRSLPWPWPTGTYTVTITSAGGSARYLLTLLAG
jgi:hypothetical protein